MPDDYDPPIRRADEVFKDCATALCGADDGWRARMGELLDIQTKSIKHFIDGSTRVPPGVWLELRGLVEARRHIDWDQLLEEIDQQHRRSTS